MILVAYELRRIVGRKGSFFGVMGVALAIAVLVAVLVDSADQTKGVWINAIGVPMVFGATVVGALAGSYDAAQGTMRYLVLTGVPRLKLVLIRLPALVLAIVLIALPALLVGLVAMLSGPEDSAGVARGLLGGLINALVWGVVSMAVGTLLRSNGAGIAVALVLFLTSSALTVFVQAKVSETVGDYLLPNVAGIVSLLGAPDADFGSDVTFLPALIALVVWLFVIVGLAVLRVERDEY